MKIQVSFGRTVTINYQSERLDVGVEYDIPDISEPEEIFAEHGASLALLKAFVDRELPRI